MYVCVYMYMFVDTMLCPDYPEVRMCVCVCIYICIYVYICECIYVCMCVYICICL